MLLFQRLLFIFPKIFLVCLAAFSHAELSWAIRPLWNNRNGVFLCERPNKLASELVISWQISWEESHEINEVILCEDSIIDSLEARVTIHSFGEWWPITLAQIPTKQVVDWKLAFSSVIQQVKSILNLFESWCLRLSLQIVNKDRIIDFLTVLRELFQDNVNMLSLQKIKLILKCVFSEEMPALRISCF